MLIRSAVVAGLSLAAGLAHAEPEPRALFNGRSLKGWQGSNAWWSVRDRAITGEIPDGQKLGQNQFLFCETAELRDFVLDFDYRISGAPSANSGVQIRSARHGAACAGYQADLDDGRTWTGRLYDEHGRGLLVERGATVTISPEGTRFTQTWASAESFRPVAAASNWNHYTISALGPRIELRVNGRLFSILEDHERGQADAAGRLAFQLHSGPGPAKIQFKDVVLRAVEHASVSNAAAAEPPAGEQPDAGVTPEGLNLGFEKGTLEGWTATGDAWKDQPVEGDTVSARRRDMRSNHAGRFWIGTYERGQDPVTGTLVSAPFAVTQPWASFLIGGGDQPGTRVEILEMPSSNVVFTARGRGGREDLERVSVDLGRQSGKSIALRIVDEGRNGWGHVNFDDFRFHAQQPQAGKPGPAAAVAGSPILQHLVPNPAGAASNILATMSVPAGFRVDLIAAEPDVTQPVAFAIDERGRLWVLEAHSYPQKREKGLDRIVIFEDADADGTFETRKLFAEGLNLASGLEVGFGGVFVGAAPELLFLPDRNHDDRPDGPAEVLLDGWGHQDTHETLNSFLWGPDGWLYGTHGVFTFSRVGRPGTPDAERTELRAGVWRYHPVTKRFEVFAHGTSNPWGLDYNEVGHLFITHCRSAWGRGETSYMIRGGHYWNQANANHAPFISAGAGGFAAEDANVFRNFLLASARYGHGAGGAGKPGSDAIYGGHSEVGTMIYLGDNWPPQYRGHLYTHNLFGRQMNREINLPDGSGYNTISAGADQGHVADPTYMGIDLQYGPDGSVFIIDWTDRQQCHHNNVEKWDRSNGRIYRMAWQPTWKPRAVDLGKMSDKQLVGQLAHPNAWHARTARRLLQERAAAAAKPSRAIRSDLPALAVKNGPAADALSHLWAAHACGTLDDTGMRKLLASTNPLVRAWAVTLLTDSPATNAAAVHLRAGFPGMAEKDESPVVRLALASALPRLADAEAWPVAERLAARDEDAADRYLPSMIWYGIASRAAPDAARALALADRTSQQPLSDSIAWFLARDAAGRARLAGHLPDMEPARRDRAMELMAFALEGRGIVEPPAGWPEVRAKLAPGATPESRRHLERLSAAFGDPEAIAKLRALLTDRTAEAAKRRDALAFLEKANDRESLPSFVALLGEPAFRKQAIPLVGRFGDAAAAPRLIAALAGADAEEKVLIANTLSGRPALARALLEEIRAGRAPKSIITSLQARQISNLGDAELTKLLGETWGKVTASSAEARKAAEKFKKLYSEAPKWAHELKDGEAAFAKACIACHAINSKGGNLGPDLGGAARSGPDYFIENIVEPNAVVGEAFQLNVITLHDGTVVSGMVNENGETLTVTAAAGVGQTVRKTEVKSRQVLEQSMMPMGLLDALQPKEVIDLIKYLTTEKK